MEQNNPSFNKKDFERNMKHFLDKCSSRYVTSVENVHDILKFIVDINILNSFKEEWLKRFIAVFVKKYLYSLTPFYISRFAENEEIYYKYISIYINFLKNIELNINSLEMN